MVEDVVVAGFGDDSVLLSVLDSDFDSDFDSPLESDFASALASLLDASDFEVSEAGVLTPFDFA